VVNMYISDMKKGGEVKQQEVKQQQQYQIFLDTRHRAYFNFINSISFLQWSYNDETEELHLFEKEK
jgi:hypothetical protein